MRLLPPELHSVVNSQSSPVLALFGHVERQYDMRLKEGDHEIFSLKPDLRDILEVEKHMRIEPSAPYTGLLQRSGGVIEDKSLAMKEGTKLPAKPSHALQFIFAIGHLGIHIIGRPRPIRNLLALPYGSDRRKKCRVKNRRVL